MDRRFRTILLAICILAYVAMPARAQTESGASSHPTVDKLVAMFDDVVFGAEIDQSMRSHIITKWKGPIRVSVRGQAKDIQISYLREHLRTVIRITGLKVEPVEDTHNDTPGDDGENMTVVFIPANEMSKIKVATVDPKLIQKLSGPRGCYFLAFREPPKSIIRSVIVVNNQRSSRAINSCLLEEILQSLGLPNDSDIVRPSIFSDHDRLTRLSRSDEILVRALYDPRVPAGTPHKEALVLVRKIIAELDTTLPPE